jgi:exodeoxyribonuclease VII small subunit
LPEAGKEFSCSWKAVDRPPAYCLQPSRLEMASRNQTMSDQKETGVESLSIEQAMERLENLVREMETGQMPLDRLISSYEEGVQLAGLCQEKLDAAAKKIQIIAKNASGQTKLEDFPLTADEP